MFRGVGGVSNYSEIMRSVVGHGLALQYIVLNVRVHLKYSWSVERATWCYQICFLNLGCLLQQNIFLRILTDLILWFVM
jgi:hypothetical protein